MKGNIPIILLQAEELLDLWQSKKGDEATVERIVEELTNMYETAMVQRIQREAYQKN